MTREFKDGGYYFVRLQDDESPFYFWTIGRFDANPDGNKGLEWSLMADDCVYDLEEFLEVGSEVILPNKE